MQLASEHMPLVERLRKGANCAVFLDGAPEPAADVADMLRKAADKIERLSAIVTERLESCSTHDADGIEHDWAKRARQEVEPKAQ